MKYFLPCRLSASTSCVFIIGILAIPLFVFSLAASATQPINVEYIDIEPDNYEQLEIIPSYGQVTENGVQYIKLVVVRDDGFGVISIARLFVYNQKKELQLISQNYHYCSEANNKCFIEFNASPSELNNLEVVLTYTNSDKSMFREYRIKGIGSLNPVF